MQILKKFINDLRAFRSWTTAAPNAPVMVKVGKKLFPIKSMSYGHGPDQIILVAGMPEKPTEKLTAEEKVEAVDILADMVNEHEPELVMEEYDENITVGVILNISMFAKFAAGAALTPAVIDAMKQLAQDDNVHELTQTLESIRRAELVKRSRAA